MFFPLPQGSQHSYCLFSEILPFLRVLASCSIPSAFYQIQVIIFCSPILSCNYGFSIPFPIFYVLHRNQKSPMPILHFTYLFLVATVKITILSLFSTSWFKTKCHIEIIKTYFDHDISLIPIFQWFPIVYQLLRSIEIQKYL